MKGTAFDFGHGRKRLHSGIPSTTEWRWGTIIKILKELMPLRVVLRCTFEANKMGGHEAVGDDDANMPDGPVRSREGRLNPDLIERTVRDTKFWCFAEMLHTLHRVLATFQGWCEGCSCHWSLKSLGRRRLAAFRRAQKEATSSTNRHTNNETEYINR